MSPILFFIIVFTCSGVGKIFLQINSAAVAFIDILIAAREGLIIVKQNVLSLHLKCTLALASFVGLLGSVQY